LPRQKRPRRPSTAFACSRASTIGYRWSQGTGNEARYRGDEREGGRGGGSGSIKLVRARNGERRLNPHLSQRHECLPGLKAVPRAPCAALRPRRQCQAACRNTRQHCPRRTLAARRPFARPAIAAALAAEPRATVAAAAVGPRRVVVGPPGRFPLGVGVAPPHLPRDLNRKKRRGLVFYNEAAPKTAEATEEAKRPRECPSVEPSFLWRLCVSQSGACAGNFSKCVVGFRVDCAVRFPLSLSLSLFSC
jgi:hypothetical protein